MPGLLAAAIGTSRLVPLVPRALPPNIGMFALQASAIEGTATNKQAAPASAR
jgi:hypothetical protein